MSSCCANWLRFQYPLMDRLGLRDTYSGAFQQALGFVSVSSDGSTWFEGHTTGIDPRAACRFSIL